MHTHNVPLPVMFVGCMVATAMVGVAGIAGFATSSSGERSSTSESTRVKKYYWASVSEPHTSVFNFRVLFLSVRPSVRTVCRIPHIVCVSNTMFENVSYRMHIDISSLHLSPYHERH